MKNQASTVEDEIRDTMAALLEEPAEKVEPQEPEEDLLADDEDVLNDVPVEKPEIAETPVKETPKVVEPAPTSWSCSVKEKWNELPPEVRSEIKKREDDIHRMMTSHDGELRLGRSVKEIAAPYEAIIRAEGGTIEGAFRDLLNTSYVLRTGSPQQKAQVLMQTAQQFGVDLGQYVGQQQQNNPLIALQNEIHQLRQQADPVRIKTQLQEDMERDRIQQEIEAFSANPENVHFEAVKSTMGSLMASGRANDLKTAYEMAIWSDPSIRAELLNAQKAQEMTKRKAEMAAKKKASASVVGSHGVATPNSSTKTIYRRSVTRSNAGIDWFNLVRGSGS